MSLTKSVNLATLKKVNLSDIDLSDYKPNEDLNWEGSFPQSVYNGLIIKVEGSEFPNMYFVMNGQKCLIPKPETVWNIFAKGAKTNFVSEKVMKEIESGPTISEIACVIFVKEKISTWYLFTNDTVHFIENPKVVKYCQFRQPFEVSRGFVNIMNKGFDIDYTGPHGS